MSDFTFIALIIIAYKLVAEPLVDGYKRKQVREQEIKNIRQNEKSKQAKENDTNDYVDYEEIG